MFQCTPSICNVITQSLFFSGEYQLLVNGVCHEEGSIKLSSPGIWSHSLFVEVSFVVESRYNLFWTRKGGGEGGGTSKDSKRVFIMCPDLHIFAEFFPSNPGSAVKNVITRENACLPD